MFTSKIAKKSKPVVNAFIWSDSDFSMNCPKRYARTIKTKIRIIEKPNSELSRDDVIIFRVDDL